VSFRHPSPKTRNRPFTLRAESGCGRATAAASSREWPSSKRLLPADQAVEGARSGDLQLVKADFAMAPAVPTQRNWKEARREALGAVVDKSKTRAITGSPFE